VGFCRSTKKKDNGYKPPPEHATVYSTILIIADKIIESAIDKSTTIVC